MPEDLIEQILGDKAVSSLTRYLAAYKIVEGNYGLFDKLARARDFEEFSRALYESLRVRDRVLGKLEEGVKRGELEITAETIDAYKVAETSIRRVLELAKENPRLVGSIISSLALAREDPRAKRRE